MIKTLRILLIAFAAFSMTACWEKKSEAPMDTLEQESEQMMDQAEDTMDDVGDSMEEVGEEIEEEIPEN